MALEGSRSQYDNALLTFWLVSLVENRTNLLKISLSSGERFVQAREGIDVGPLRVRVQSHRLCTDMSMHGCMLSPLER